MKEMSEESIEFVVGRLEKMSTGRELSQKELAELSGVGQPTISKIFSGTQRPSVDLLQKLCAAFGLTLSGVLEEIDPECQYMIGYLATPLTAVVESPEAEPFLRRSVMDEVTWKPRT